jgi:hypothetical protein
MMDLRWSFLVDHREAGGDVVSGLVAEHAERAGSRPVGLGPAVLEHVAQEVEILLHAVPSSRERGG